MPVDCRDWKEAKPMRLTLRTLLAWLDDTLSPSEVREIGKQVSESEFAKELVDRIHRVARQRRLSIPPRTGPEAVDPNMVASYLDNQLEPEGVADFEKKCLTSDVHLAEVASVHQILSLIGQRAKVPVEARHRMYQMIKGRESVKPQAPRASKQTEPKPVSEPVQPWVTPTPPLRPWYERYLPPTAVVALILILCWSAWRSLEPPESSPRLSSSLAANLPALPGGPAPAASPAGVARPPAGGEAAESAKPGGAPAGAEALASPSPATAAKTEENVPPRVPGESTAAKPQEKSKGNAEKPPAEVRAGSAGIAMKPAGILLRYNPSPERRGWDRLTEATPLNEQDRILSLAPFRANLEIGKSQVDLVGETEVWVGATSPTEAARLSLAQGRLVIHAPAPALPLDLQFGGKSIIVTPPPGASIGVERINRRPPGDSTAQAPALRFYSVEGATKIGVGPNEESLDGPGAVSVESDGTFTDREVKAAPDWVTEREPSTFDQKVGEQFLKYFQSRREVISSLVEASEDPQKDVCRRAIQALRAVGDISFIVPLLNRRGDPTAATSRKEAIAVLRAFLAQGPEAAKTLREQLRRDLGDDQAVIVEKLLVGFTAKEAKDAATFARLVGNLGSTDDGEVGLRELALDNLRQITGRDDLEYDPEKPKGKGLEAWREVLRDRDLRPAPNTKKTEK
jgi:hypothetical protein